MEETLKSCVVVAGKGVKNRGRGSPHIPDAKEEAGEHATTVKLLDQPVHFWLTKPYKEEGEKQKYRLNLVNDGGMEVPMTEELVNAFGKAKRFPF